nr:hypothetical protein [Tanacetum cinerariifolium]
MPKIEKYVTETLGAEVLVRTTNQPQMAYAVTASLSKFELKKILIDKVETNKSINRSDTQKNLYNALDEMIKTRIKTPPLDQTEGRKEGNLVKMLSPPKIHGLRKRSLQAPPEMFPNLN